MIRHLLCLLLLPLATIAQMVPTGWLDVSFGKSGSDTIYNSTIVLLSAFGGDSLLAVGNDTHDAVIVSKFDNNGHLCTAFGANGSFHFQTPGYENAFVQATLIQPDGKIVIGQWASDTDSNPATSTFDDFVIVRLMPNGSFDTSFNKTGILGADFDHQANTLFSIAIQPDGKILACGTTTTDTGQRMELARFNINGSFDSTFGNAGRTEMPINANGNGMYVVLQPDGKIIVAGSWGAQGATYKVFMRFNAAGKLDSTFGVNGQNIGLAPNVEIFSLRLLPNGKFLTSGFWEMARYNANGDIDNTFGSNGAAHPNVNLFYVTSDACGTAIGPDGKIVYAITEDSNGVAVELLARFNNDGALDTTFGVGGIVRNFVTEINGYNDYIHAVQVQSSGKIIASGFYQTAIADGYGFLTRYYQTATSVPTISKESCHFAFYPNPADRDITITSYQSQGKVLLRILDANGRLVQTEELQFENGVAKLHTELVPGIYSAQLMSEQNGGNQTEKLVIAQ